MCNLSKFKLYIATFPGLIIGPPKNTRFLKDRTRDQADMNHLKIAFPLTTTYYSSAQTSVQLLYNQVRLDLDKHFADVFSLE